MKELRTDRIAWVTSGIGIALMIPTVFSVVILASFVGFPESDGFVLANGAAVIVQGIVYFMFGKLISRWAKRFRTERNRTQ